VIRELENKRELEGHYLKQGVDNMAEMSKEAKAAKRAYMREWRKKNRDKTNEYLNKWRKENPDKVKEYERKYWEKKAAEQERKEA
jgi:hypothetical protein